MVQESIKERLQQLADQKLVYHSSDCDWRHFGRWSATTNQIYLFDLGDLKVCSDRNMATTVAMQQYHHLIERTLPK